MESAASVFKELLLPETAFQNFLQNVGQSNVIRKATDSELVEGHVASSLAQTWFIIPEAQNIRAPSVPQGPVRATHVQTSCLVMSCHKC